MYSSTGKPSNEVRQATSRVVGRFLFSSANGNPPIRSTVMDALDEYETYLNGLLTQQPPLSLDQIATRTKLGSRVRTTDLGKTLMRMAHVRITQFRSICQIFYGLIMDFLTDDLYPMNDPQHLSNLRLSLIQKFEGEFEEIFNEVRVSRYR